jgi:hypothetical protein
MTAGAWLNSIISGVIGGILVFFFTEFYKKSRPRFNKPKLLKIGDSLLWVIPLTNMQGFLHCLIQRESVTVFDPVGSIDEKVGSLRWMNSSGSPVNSADSPKTLGEGQNERLFSINKVCGNTKFALGTSDNPPIFDEGVFLLKVYLNHYLYEYNFAVKNKSTDFVLIGPISLKKANWYLNHPELIKNKGNYQERITIEK